MIKHSLENDDVLIKVLNSPVNFSDYYGYRGSYPNYKKYPFILGFEGYGEIIDVKDETKKSLIGKKVNFFTTDQKGSYS